jgi:hypothetical protein
MTYRLRLSQDPTPQAAGTKVKGAMQKATSCVEPGTAVWDIAQQMRDIKIQPLLGTREISQREPRTRARGVRRTAGRRLPHAPS